MSKQRYFYDVELHKINPPQKVRTLYSGITGKEVKKVYSKQYPNNREIKIYKTDAVKKTRRLHRTLEFGFETEIADHLSNLNLHYYGVEVETEESGDCENYGCDMICRCRTIESIWVSEVKLESVIDVCREEMMRSFDRYKLKIDRGIAEYCFDRILNGAGLDDTNAYEAASCGGYYGDEIDYVKIENVGTIVDLASRVANAENNYEALKVVLEDEYGYILDKLKDKTLCEVVSVDLSQVKVSNHTKLNKKILKRYCDKIEINRDLAERKKKWTYRAYFIYDRPIGVCEIKDYDYRLIDGFHRHKAAETCKKEKVNIVVVK